MNGGTEEGGKGERPHPSEEEWVSLFTCAMQLKESFERLPLLLLLLFALLLPLDVLHCHLGTTPKLIKAAAAAVTARWKRRPG